MSVSFKHRLIHVHIPKNAGSTINKMTPCDVFPKLPYGPNLCCNGRSFRCGVAELHRNYVGEHHWDEFTSFAVLRNPWSRMVSGWLYCSPALSFKSFVLNLDNFRNNPSILWHVITPQKKHITDNNNKIIVKEVGYVEKLDDFMRSLSLQYNFPIKQTRRLNTTEHRHYSEYYDDNLRDVVGNRFTDDVNLGKYKFGD